MHAGVNLFSFCFKKVVCTRDLFGETLDSRAPTRQNIPCCCCCSHINSHNQVRGHRTGSSHSGAEEYPRENTHNPRWYTHISQLTRFMPPPETYKSEIGSQSTICQVQAGAYVSLLTPGETKYSDCHPRKTTTYILHVVSITTHTHDRHKSIGEKETKKRKYMLVAPVAYQFFLLFSFLCFILLSFLCFFFSN